MPRRNLIDQIIREAERSIRERATGGRIYAFGPTGESAGGASATVDAFGVIHNCFRADESLVDGNDTLCS